MSDSSDTTVTLTYKGEEIDVTDALKPSGKPNQAFKDMVGDVLTDAGIRHTTGGRTMARSQPRLVEAPVEMKEPTKTIAKGLGSGGNGLAAIDDFADLIEEWIEYNTMAGDTEDHVKQLSAFVEALRYHAGGLHRVLAEIHTHEADQGDSSDPLR